MQHSEFFNDMNRQVENLISGHRVNDETVFTSADAKEWKRIVQAINEQEKQIAAALAEKI